MNLDGNQYRIIVEFSPNLIWRAGTDGLCDYFNSTWLEFTGRSMEEEVGNGWADGVHPEDLDRCLKTYLEAFAKHEAFEMNYRLKRFDGEWRWINDRGAPCYDKGEFKGYVGSCMDITEQVYGESWKRMAQKDGLTGINNRQYFEQLAKRETEQARRNKNPLCIIMMDIDNFKSINDRYGHQAGDKVLIAFAKFFEKSLREFDILGRFGGDEFIICMPSTTAEGAESFLIRLTEMMHEPFSIEGIGSINLSFSYGISDLKFDESFELLVSWSDREMYRHKMSKKNTGN